MATTVPEKHTFQAEVQQLLDIVIHSLYTDKEIFIRELVSNASDALEKLRHLQLTEKEIFDADLPLEINLTTDDTAGTITIQDFGVGLTREELRENLGTIAHSGSKAFLHALKEAGGGEATQNLIGQFGVGFYAAFMAAEEVTVYTHSWRPEAEHLIWRSRGAGEYEIEPSEGQRRGAKIVLKLKEEAKEFASESRLKDVLKKYSNFVSFPINVNGERLNTVGALWTKQKSEITDEEYQEFYKFTANAFDEPRYRLHFSADAPLEIASILFVPQMNLERMGFMRTEPGVGLYCRKVLIDPKPESLLPEWLRFLRGVVDSADLPLNISRESMQDSALVRKLGTVLTKRFLKFLEDEAKKDAGKYAEFFAEFGLFLKEGLVSDHAHKEQLGKLMRFESSMTEPGKVTSLADYVLRMPEDQKEIYYLPGSSRKAIENGPYLEAFQARNLEVLYLYEPVDVFVMEHLGTFEEKALTSGESGDLKLERPADATNNGEPLPEEDVQALAQFLRDAIGDRIKDVHASDRLVNSPVAILSTDKMMSPSMRRLMRQMNKEAGDALPAVDLGINPRHPLIHGLNRLRGTNEEAAKLASVQLFDSALLAAGLMDDPSSYVQRSYEVLEKWTRS